MARLGLALLWPGGSRGSAADFEADARVTGTVDNITIVPCTGTAVEDLIDYLLAALDHEGSAVFEIGGRDRVRRALLALAAKLDPFP